MKFTANTRGHRAAPRNPMVAPARFRSAGAHGQRDARQEARRALARELDRLLGERPRPSP